jgi:hypothetical protein
MSEVILNLAPSKKKKRSKNLCSTRDLVAKLFIAILMNFRYGEVVAYCAMVTFYFIDHAVAAGGYFFLFSYCICA